MGLSPDQGKEFRPSRVAAAINQIPVQRQTSAILAAEGQRATGKARGTASAILMSANGTRSRQIEMWKCELFFGRKLSIFKRVKVWDFETKVAKRQFGNRGTTRHWEIVWKKKTYYPILCPNLYTILPMSLVSRGLTASKQPPGVYFNEVNLEINWLKVACDENVHIQKNMWKYSQIHKFT